MPTLKKVVFAILSILLSILFFWSAADIVTSVTGEKPTSMSLETEYIEGRGAMLRRGFQSQIAFVSEEGLRRNGSLPPLVFGEKRILFVGESTCFSYYVMQGQDWPTIVGEELRSSGVKATTMNGGVPGYQMRDAEFAYKWFKPQWPVDIVVIYLMWNDFVADHSSLPDFNFDIAEKDFYQNWPSSLKLNLPYEKYDTPTPKRFIGNTLLKPLQPLITTSPLAHKLYFIGNNTLRNLNWLLNSEKGGDIEYEEVMHSAARKYMFHLGNLIQQAKQDGTQVVIVKPFSVFRMENYEGPNRDELLRHFVGQYPQANWHSIMQNWIAQADTVIDEFAKIKNVVVIDPTEGMLKKINSKNAYNKDYSKSYMGGSPHHTGAKGDRLLGKIVAQELIKKGLVQPTDQAPWIHPFEEIKESPEFLMRYSKFPLRVQTSMFSANKLVTLGPSFILMMLCSLIGAMILLAIAGVNQFESNYIWSGTLGMGVMMSLFICLNQIFSNPSASLVVSVIFLLVVFAAILFRNGTISGPHLKRVLGKTFLCGFIGFFLLLGANQINIEKVKSSDTRTINVFSHVISQYLAWMDFQANYSLFEDGTASLAELYEKGRNSDLSKTRNPQGLIGLYSKLLRWPDYHDHVAPMLASSIYMIFENNPEDIFLSILGVPAAVLATPILIFLLLGRLSIIKRIIMLSIFVFSFYIGFKILIPIAQYGIIGVVTMILAIYLTGNKFYRGIVFSMGAGISILVPDPMILLLLFAIALVCGIKNSMASTIQNKNIGLSVAGAIVLMVFGKSLMLDYPAAHAPIFEFLKEKGLILFGSWTQTDVILLLLVFCCLGYFLVRQSSSLLIALLTLASIFASFHYSQVVFRAIPVSAVIVLFFLEFTKVYKHNQIPKIYGKHIKT